MIDPKVSVLRFAADGCELKEEFARADKDGDDRIDFGEFSQLTHGVRPGMSETDLLGNFRRIDLDHDGLIDFGEFLDWSRGD